jgi:small subunit ribosomal protein S6
LAATREYELVLMLDAGQDAPARDALAQQARAQIEGGGTLKHENNWGLRKLAYEIAQRNEADYRWFRFEAPPELLEEIDHSLKITDGVLRFRIFKVDPDAPVMVPPATAAPGPESSRERPSGPPRQAPPPETAAEPTPEPDAEAAADATPEPAAAAEPSAELTEEPAAEPAADVAAEPAPEPAKPAPEAPAEPAE